MCNTGEYGTIGIYGWSALRFWRSGLPSIACSRGATRRICTCSPPWLPIGFPVIVYEGPLELDSVGRAGGVLAVFRESPADVIRLFGEVHLVHQVP
jgi:hypothetical protein